MPSTDIPPKTAAEALGQRLRAWRIRSKLTADQVATRLGTSRASLYRFEEGAVIKLQDAEHIAKIVGVPLHEILRDVEPRARPDGKPI